MPATPCGCVPCSTWVDLYLLRHGIAVERINGRDHPSRGLTTKGRSRTLRVVKALAAAGFQADQAISSPYLRAMETAWLAHRGGLAPPPVPCARLQPGGPGMDRLADIAGTLLLVGHEPDLGRLASLLIGAPVGAIRLRKAGFCHLRWAAGEEALAGRACLERLVSPGVLRR